MIKRTILLLAFACTASHAEFKDGNKLYSQMTSGVNSDWFTAIGYVTGVADAGYGTVSCPPPNVTAGQVFDAVKQHMENAPTLRHFAADIIINHVMGKAWPCPKRGSSL